MRPLVPEVEPVTFEGSLTLEHPLELLEPLVVPGLAAVERYLREARRRTDSPPMRFT